MSYFDAGYFDADYFDAEGVLPPIVTPRFGRRGQGPLEWYADADGDELMFWIL
jgi:hypothetical protein